MTSSLNQPNSALPTLLPNPNGFSLIDHIDVNGNGDEAHLREPIDGRERFVFRGGVSFPGATSFGEGDYYVDNQVHVYTPQGLDYGWEQISTVFDTFETRVGSTTYVSYDVGFFDRRTGKSWGFGVQQAEYDRLLQMYGVIRNAPNPGSVPPNVAETPVLDTIFYNLSYGNYIGPGWSAGRRVHEYEELADVDWSVAPVSTMDRLARTHDLCYGGNDEMICDKSMITGFLEHFEDMSFKDMLAIMIILFKFGLGIRLYTRQSKPPKIFLVGVELNPGPDPPKGIAKRLKKKFGKAKKQMVKAENRLMKQEAGQLRQLKKKAETSMMVRPLSAPVSQNMSVEMGVPRTTYSKNGDIIVSHSELVTTFRGTGNTSSWVMLFQSAINPGSAFLFPWLSTIAQGYEFYKFKRLTFSFLSSSPSSYAGQLQLAIDYDATDVAPGNPTQMSQLKRCSKGMVWQPVLNHHFNPKDANRVNKYFIRTPAATQVTNDDYDCGFFYASLKGYNQTTTLDIGDLYVTYEVELSTSQWINTYYQGPSQITVGPITAAAYAANLLFPAGNVITGNNANIAYTSNSIILYQPGTYRIILQLYDSNGSNMYPTHSGLQNCALTAPPQLGGTTYVEGTDGSTLGHAIFTVTTSATTVISYQNPATISLAITSYTNAGNIGVVATVIPVPTGYQAKNNKPLWSLGYTSSSPSILNEEEKCGSELGEIV